MTPARGETTATAGAARGDWLLIGAGVLASLALLWLVSGQMLVVAGFAGGVLALGGLVRMLSAQPQAAVEADYALPDWSVTVAAIDRADTGIAIIDRAGRLVCANPRYEAWFGAGHAPPRLPVDKTALERLALAARHGWRDGAGTVARIESSGQTWSAQVIRAGRGDDFLVWKFTPLQTADPVAEMVLLLDGKFGRALSQAGIAAAMVDPDGKIRAASAGFALRAVGDGNALLTGQDFVSLLLQDDHVRISWARDGRKGAPLTMFYLPVADPDLPGEPDPHTTPSLMLLVDAGTGMGSGAASESGASVPHLEALLGQLPLGLAMADRDGRLLFANPAFMRAAGKEGELPPTYPTDLVLREDKGPLSDAIRRFAQGPASSGDIAIRLAGQVEDPVSLSLAGVRGLGEAAVLLGLTDNSEETRLKRQVAQATKMQAVGQLAGGVAHDFNNVLTAILGICDLMLLRHTPGDSDYDDIQQIRANSNRAASLTRQLLAFSRQQTLRPEVLQLPDVVSDVSQMLRRLIGEKIKLVVTHDRDLGPVRADPTQLEQVIVNLCVNARDAMQARGSGGSGGGGAGTLTLATRRITASAVRAMRSEILPQADYTALVVQDTGSGIPPEHLGKIWEPFFTTKETGKGTGLGLSTVYGIVKQSGGFIFADSEVGPGPNTGTTFTVYLPVHHGTAGPEPARTKTLAAPQAEWSGGGRVLLVEDEDMVRAVAERALARAGFTVTSASDGDEGLELVQAGGEFDIVVSDVVMPAMDGPAMAKEIRKLRPAMPILFMSGYAEEQLRKELDLDNVEFLPKPFSVQQISDKVGAVLGAAKA